MVSVLSLSAIDVEKNRFGLGLRLITFAAFLEKSLLPWNLLFAYQKVSAVLNFDLPFLLSF
jgi:hypothetical protein